MPICYCCCICCCRCCCCMQCCCYYAASAAANSAASSSASGFAACIAHATLCLCKLLWHFFRGMQIIFLLSARPYSLDKVSAKNSTVYLSESESDRALDCDYRLSSKRTKPTRQQGGKDAGGRSSLPEKFRVCWPPTKACILLCSQSYSLHALRGAELCSQ